MITKTATNQFFKHLDAIAMGQITVVTPNGQTEVFGGQMPGNTATIKLNDWRVIPNMMRKGDIGLAEDYRAGRWETDDLVSLITLALYNRWALEPFINGSKIARVIAKLSYLMKLNTLRGSRKNIHAHYDLGNAFYKLWLDPSMTYSAALFQNETETLHQAQNNKYDRIIDCLGSTSGSLLEIGCGWGGLAERAVEKRDFSVKGITLSQAQQDHAQNRLKGKATIALEDYRHQTGQFDHIVSIEMFEAVGERYWPAYFSKINTLLNRGGKAVIQTITMNEKDFPRYRNSGDFIRSYIFPGGMLPSPSRFNAEAAQAGLSADNAFFFGQSYAKTLELWLHAFDANLAPIKAQGFDDGFIRLWRFYLAACIAGFRTGQTDVMQVELSHA